MFEDMTLTCKDCGAEFVFTAGEQEFYESRGFKDKDGNIQKPGKCKPCRDAAKGYRKENA